MTESALQRSMRLAELSLEPNVIEPYRKTYEYPQIGDKFGRWTVVGTPRRDMTQAGHNIVMPCRCSCGYESRVQAYKLKCGDALKCYRCSNRQQAARVKFAEWKGKQERLAKRANT